MDVALLRRYPAQNSPLNPLVPMLSAPAISVVRAAPRPLLLSLSRSATFKPQESGDLLRMLAPTLWRPVGPIRPGAAQRAGVSAARAEQSVRPRPAVSAMATQAHPESDEFVVVRRAGDLRDIAKIFGLNAESVRRIVNGELEAGREIPGVARVGRKYCVDVPAFVAAWRRGEISWDGWKPKG